MPLTKAYYEWGGSSEIRCPGGGSAMVIGSIGAEAIRSVQAFLGHIFEFVCAGFFFLVAVDKAVLDLECFSYGLTSYKRWGVAFGLAKCMG